MPAVTGEKNWAGNYLFKAARLHRPRTVEEVQSIVATGAQVRAIGARHSFNGVADTPGDLIDLADVATEIEIAADGRTATVGAAASYGAVAQVLQARGFALHNMGSLPHITVAGATATGTHGSGDRNGSLATAVAALELVDASGALVMVRRGEREFDGMVVGLGAFGVVTRVTLDIQPTFQVRQDAFADLPWDTLLARLDEVFSCAYSVSIMTMWSQPTLGSLWLKTRLEDGEPQEVTAAHLGAVPGPAHVAGIGAELLTGLNPFGGIPGPWSERLAHFRPDQDPGVSDQIQSEYMVPRVRAVEALEAVRRIGTRVDALLYMTELRSVAADQLWLSEAHGGDTVALHFTWKREPAAVDALTRELEDMLIPLGGRPHWGKLLHAPSATLAPLYPRMAEFRALAALRDPDRKFRNAFLDRHVF